MDTLQLGTTESEVLEDTGLSIVTAGEVLGDYEDEQSRTAKPAAAKASQKSSSGNVVYAYLKEVKNWPILSRDEEYVFAKAYYEAEVEKAVLLQKWVQTFERCCNRRQLNAVTGESADSMSSNTQRVLDVISRISELLSSIAVLDEKARSSALSAYMKKKLECEKDQITSDMEQYCRRVDLIQLYRSGAVRSLYRVLKTRIATKARRSVIQILKSYIGASTTSQESKERLISSNLRLVIGIAKKYSNRGLTLPDLIQEGNIGLIRSIEKFDYRLGNRLSTYASWWIRQTVIRAIEEKSSTIRVPIYINDKIKKLLRNSTDETSQAEVAEKALNDSGNLYFAMQLSKDPISLETPFSDDGGNLHECIPDKESSSAVDQIESTQLSEITDQLLRGLSPRDERILRMRFGVGGEPEHTLEEIGERFNLSRERIRQIETKALHRIRASESSRELRAYMYEEAI